MHGTTLNKVISFNAFTWNMFDSKPNKRKKNIKIIKTKIKPNLYKQFESKGFQK